MRTITKIMFIISCLCSSLSVMEVASRADETSAKPSDDVKRVSLKTAQERARLLHKVYSSTLDVMHHRYFNDDRSTVPARALEDVFREIEREEQIKARWIGVNAKVLNIDHKPANDFEEQAAKAIAAGEEDYELVEEGVYRRAKGISLSNRGCLSCHLGFGTSGKKERFAGLVISIPIIKE